MIKQCNDPWAETLHLYFTQVHLPAICYKIHQKSRQTRTASSKKNNKKAIIQKVKSSMIMTMKVNYLINCYIQTYFSIHLLVNLWEIFTIYYVSCLFVLYFHCNFFLTAEGQRFPCKLFVFVFFKCDHPDHHFWIQGNVE